MALQRSKAKQDRRPDAHEVHKATLPAYLIKARSAVTTLRVYIVYVGDVVVTIEPFIDSH